MIDYQYDYENDDQIIFLVASVITQSKKIQKTQKANKTKSKID